MHWQQHYDPLNRAALSTVVAALPVVVLLGSSAMLRIRIHYTALDRAFNLTPPLSWVGQQTYTMTVSGVLRFTNPPVCGTNNFWRVRSVP